PPAQQPQPPAPQPPAPGPQPGPPSLTASAAGASVSLIAGGAPADLPITVRNTGGSVSGPVSATLNLPPGVTAIPSGPSGFAGAPLLRLNAKQSSTVFCPGGTGTVTCGTGAGLAPNESVTLLFRVVAAANSPGGEITGSVSDGSPVSVRVAVRVVVQPPPTVDGVEVKAHGSWLDTLLPGLLGRPLLHVTATNTGTSAKPITVTVNRHGARLSSSTPMTCTSTDASTSCATTAPVEPRSSVHLSIKLATWLGLLHRCDDPSVVVTAVLGSASDSQTIRVDCWALPGLPWLVPNGTDAPPAPPEPQAPPRPPTKPHLQSPAGPLTPSTPPAPVPDVPPSPLPKIEPPKPPAPPTTTPTAPTAPPPSGPLLGPLLGWLLPG
ncbi:MAG TPA: hypothetical protein VGX25_23415, partial [Actinophytocola sp.]|nr:hypothetical protein [Actinophytocola sp.]